MEIRSTLVLSMLLVLVAGCADDKDTRIAKMTRRHEIRQTEQNLRAADLQREVTAIHRSVQTERAAINRERDKLEEERREIASSRRLDSLTAVAITNIGLILASLLPLGLIWLLLAKPPELGSEQMVVDLMLDDLIANQPFLFDREGDAGYGRFLGGTDTDDAAN